MRDSHKIFRTVDFRPVEPGWQAAFVDHVVGGDGVWYEPVVGWAIQEEVWVDGYESEIENDNKPAENRERRVVPVIYGHADDGLMELDVDRFPKFWAITNHKSMSLQETTAEIDRRREAETRRASA